MSDCLASPLKRYWDALRAVLFCFQHYHLMQKTWAALFPKHNSLSNGAQLWEKRPGHANSVGPRSLGTHSHAEDVQKAPALEGGEEG